MARGGSPIRKHPQDLAAQRRSAAAQAGSANLQPKDGLRAPAQTKGLNMNTIDQTTQAAQSAGVEISHAIAGLTTSAAGVLESQINALSSSLSMLADGINQLQDTTVAAVNKTLTATL